MRHIISALVLLALCALPLTAADVGTMTQAERATLRQQLDQADKPVEVRVREEAAQWADLGANVGKAMIGAAKELGLAANDFAQTSLGKIVIAILVVKIIGGTILHIVVAGVALFMSWGFFWYVHCRIARTPKYEVRPVLWGLWQHRTVVGYTDAKSVDDAWGFFSIAGLVAGFITTIISLITAV